MKKMLLHTCCAPCTLIPLSTFMDEGYSVCAAFVNPNIHPLEEYERRHSLLVQYCGDVSVTVYEIPGFREDWEDTAGRLGGPYPLVKNDPLYDHYLEKRRARCTLCYRLRFEETARYAAECGFDSISTTLSISPYQFTDLICMELEKAASAHGLQALYVDFTRSYPEATRLSRQMGMYRQNYCGCRYSYEEALIERSAQKAVRTSFAQAGPHAGKGTKSHMTSTTQAGS